jgi:hypothetical protein
MQKESLTPRKIIHVNGKIHYNESNQAWNLIKLKSEFLNEFSQLKEKRSKFSYEMVFGRSEEEMVGLLKESMRDKKLRPVLMFLYRDSK